MIVAAVLPLSSPSQETALECHFGTDRTFEARWVNASAVECVHVLVSPAPAPPTVCGRAEDTEGLAPHLPPSSHLLSSLAPSLPPSVLPSTSS